MVFFSGEALEREGAHLEKWSCSGCPSIRVRTPVNESSE